MSRQISVVNPVDLLINSEYGDISWKQWCEFECDRLQKARPSLKYFIKLNKQKTECSIEQEDK